LSRTPMLRLPSIIATVHMGLAHTTETAVAMGRMPLDAWLALAVLPGERLAHIINSQLYEQGGRIKMTDTAWFLGIDLGTGSCKTY